MNTHDRKNGSGPTGEASSSANHSLQDYLLIIRDRWLLGLTMGLLVAGVFLYQRLSEVPVYVSAVKLNFEQKTDRIVNDMEQVVDNNLRGEYELNDHKLDLESRSFRNRVVDKIPDDMAKKIQAPYEEPEVPAPSVGAIIAGGLGVSRVNNTTTFVIYMEHRDPKMAKYIAQLYAEEYIEFILDRSENSNVGAIKFLTARAEDLKQRVEAGERALQDYKKQHNMSSIEETANVVDSRVQTLHNELTSLNISRLSSEALLRDIEEAKANNANLLELPAISGYGNLGELQQRLENLRADEALLSKRYLERHPSMININSRIAVVEQQIEDNIDKAIIEIHNGFEITVKREENLLEELARTEEEARKVDEMKIEFNIMRRELAQIESKFNQITERLNETDITSKLEMSNIRIIDSASESGSPVRPDKEKIYFMAGGILLAIFVALPLGLEFLNNRLHSEWDVTTFLGRELLGDISLNRRLSRQELATTVASERDLTILENFRALYGHINLQSSKDEPKTMIISSTLPSEGKTFVSCNLASVFAKHGHRTLLCDTDFRRPSVHGNWEISNENGFLRWWYSGEEPDQDADAFVSRDILGIQEVEQNLHVLPSGGKTKSTTEILSDARFERFLQTLKRRYDVILFDTPPAGIFPDAIFLADLADEAMFVVKYNSVSRTKVKMALSHLEKSDTDILGVVINAVSNKARKRYGYSSYYDYSYYGRYYDREERVKKRSSSRSKSTEKPAETTKV